MGAIPIQTTTLLCHTYRTQHICGGQRTVYSSCVGPEDGIKVLDSVSSTCAHSAISLVLICFPFETGFEFIKERLSCRYKYRALRMNVRRVKEEQ